MAPTLSMSPRRTRLLLLLLGVIALWAVALAVLTLEYIRQPFEGVNKDAFVAVGGYVTAVLASIAAVLAFGYAAFGEKSGW